MEAVPGYLSLHQSAESLTLKWTPNQLMNGTLGDSELEKRWGLWYSLPEAVEGSESLPPGRGMGRQASHLTRCQELQREASWRYSQAL